MSSPPAQTFAEREEENKGKQHSHLYSSIIPSDKKEREEVLKTLAKDPIEFDKSIDQIKQKLDKKPLLLDNPESKRLKKRCKTIKCLTNVMKTSKKDNQRAIDENGLGYEQMLPLNKLWDSYMKDLISVTQKTGLENALLRADYHGSYLRVVQSKCPNLVGKNGIVMQETMQTFVIIQADRHQPITIPKRGSVFHCSVGRTEWHLYGDQLCVHSGLRSARKFKSKSSVTL